MDGDRQVPPSGTDTNEFERLLEETGMDRFRPIAAGERVRGRVVSISASAVMVDIGQRSEGVLPIEQFTPEEQERLAVGQDLDAYVKEITGSGIELSRAGAGRSLDLEQLKEAQRSGMPIEGKVTGENKGGFTVDVKGARGFVPFSQIELGAARPAAEYIGQTLRFRVLEIRGKDAVLSRAALLRAEQEEERGRLLADLAEGQLRTAPVVKIERFGAFVDLGGGVHALVPTSELAWSRQDDVRAGLATGQALDVKIVKIEPQAGRPDRPRITASVRQTGKDPWEDLGGQFTVGQVLKGSVTRLAPFGAFIEIGPGIEGLLHVSEMSRTRRIQHPGEIVRPGDELEVSITAVDAAARRIGLSMATAPEEQIDDETRAKYMGGGGGRDRGGDRDRRRRPAPAAEEERVVMPPQPAFGNSLADAMRRALENKKK